MWCDKTDNVIKALLWCQQRNSFTAKQLATHLGVSIRTVYRYINILSLYLPLCVIGKKYVMLNKNNKGD